MTNLPNTGWTITQSICLELDQLINLFSNRSIMRETVQDYAGLLEAVRPEWVDELVDLTGKSSQGWNFMEALAVLSGQIHTLDYGAATLAMRSMDMDGFRARLLELIHANDLPVDTSNPDLAEMLAGFRQAVFETQNLHPLQDPLQRTRAEVQVLEAILRGGKSHDHFWHWLDRLYYEAYLPWRKTRQPVIDELMQQAQLGLGAESADGTVPALFWLSEMNPLLRIPELKQGVEDGRLRVHFWVEPFALADSFLLLPGEILVTIALPGALYQNFYQFSTRVAARMQALADPTRLVILRLIRNIGMNNTDMAEFLHISRPTVSIHARILRDAGLIRSHAEGRITRHEIIPGELNKLFDDLRVLLDLPDEP